MKTVKIGDYVQIVRPKTKIQSKKFLGSGKYPIVSQEARHINGYWDNSDDVMHFDKPVVVFGDHTRSIKYIDFSFVAGADGTKILLPPDNLCTRYLYYWLFANPIEGLGYARHFRILKEMKINIPSLHEQRRTVEWLDAAFEKIDRAIELTEENLTNTYKLFGSILQDGVSKYNDTENEELGNIADIEYGLTEKSQAVGEYRLVRITDIDDTGTLRDEDKVYVGSNTKSDKYLLNRGDLVVARTGATFGKVLYFNSSEVAVFASYLIRINFKKDIEPKLFWYFAKTPQYWDQANLLAGGAAQPQFNGNALKQIRFSYPKDRNEQKSVVERLDDQNEKILRMQQYYQRKIELLRLLKQSILTQAFSESDVK